MQNGNFYLQNKNRENNVSLNHVLYLLCSLPADVEAYLQRPAQKNFKKCVIYFADKLTFTKPTLLRCFKSYFKDHLWTAAFSANMADMLLDFFCCPATCVRCVFKSKSKPLSGITARNYGSYCRKDHVNHVNHFMLLFSYPLKVLEKLTFPHVFGRYRKRPVAWNVLSM